MRFQKSADTKVIESVLREASVGDTVSYDSLSQALGRDVRQFARGAMDSARKALLREGVVFGVETNVGLVRLNDSQIVTSAEQDRKKMHRQANRSIEKLELVKFEELSEDDKKKHTAFATQMGVLALFSKKSSTKKIESRVNGSSVIPIGETLKLFS